MPYAEGRVLNPDTARGPEVASLRREGLILNLFANSNIEVAMQKLKGKYSQSATTARVNRLVLDQKRVTQD